MLGWVVLNNVHDISYINSVRFFFLFLPDCHEACSECRGPGRQECLSCSDPAALLKDGACVSHCGAGFYSQDGVCYGNVDVQLTFPTMKVLPLSAFTKSAALSRLCSCSLKSPSSHLEVLCNSYWWLSCVCQWTDDRIPFVFWDTWWLSRLFFSFASFKLIFRF